MIALRNVAKSYPVAGDPASGDTGLTLCSPALKTWTQRHAQHRLSHATRELHTISGQRKVALVTMASSVYWPVR